MAVKTIVKKIDHECILVTLRSDGIVHVIIKPHVEINLELQKDMIKIYNEITEGKRSPFLFETNEFNSITKEARENAIQIELQTPTAASAVLVKNLGHKIIADFYYKVNRPIQPYKVFWSKEKAIKWLLSLEIV